MNNHERFTDALEFCALSPTCRTCPYSLYTRRHQDASTKPCFTSKEDLEALERWLHSEDGKNDPAEELLSDDEKWLQDLLKLQFDDDEDELEF
ncbi:MAG: hypothetical protein GX911_02660 [Spirochaetales bacterium]|nr:hypothetical protein [Spirochaetales bacterium]